MRTALSIPPPRESDEQSSISVTARDRCSYVFSPTSQADDRKDKERAFYILKHVYMLYVNSFCPHLWDDASRGTNSGTPSPLRPLQLLRPKNKNRLPVFAFV